MYNLTVMSEVLSGDLTEDYSPGNSLSTLRKWYEGVREEPGYIRVFGTKGKKKIVVECQKMTAIHNNQKSQVMILVLLYVWEEARV